MKILDKPEVANGIKLPIMEHFYTVQGEGSHSGRAAYFIRLAGCDVGCVWCDVKESWDADVTQLMSVEEITNQVLASKTDYVVITGGEPLMHNCEPLTKALAENGIEIGIETSGAHSFSGVWHWICLSPKKFKLPLEEAYTEAQELKIIIFNKHDFAWAEEQANKVGKDCVLFLQPEWDKQDKMLPKIIDYVKQNPKWRISLQTHKYMNIP